jgi:leucine dehydrogenase
VLDDLIKAWDGEEVVAHFDRPGSTWMFVCVHSTRRGPAGGGTRMKAYETPSAALEDAMRLAKGMTLKMAAAELPFGGGKAVLAVSAVPEGEPRRRLLHRYADLVASLGGTYRTGPDVNTTPADMDVIGERTPHVFCRTVERGGSGGVFHGIRASVAHAYGSADLADRSVLVQGVGDVGTRLVELLTDAGARVLVSDIATERARDVADRTGAEVVDADAALAVACDVYAPCALGATLNAESIPGLRCRIVAGAANNQLAEPEDAERLRAAGILYAPDFVINAGGVLYAWGVESLGWSREQVEARLEGIGATLNEIFTRAEADGFTSDVAAHELALSRLR